MNLLLGNFDEREIVIRFSATSSFSPVTDIFTLNTYRVEMENWGRVDMGFTMSGLNAFMTNTSLSDMTNLTTPPPPGPPTIPRNELAALIALYRDVSINSGQMELTDTGGMEKAVRMSTAMRERRRSGTAVNLTPSQVQETRLRWALTPRTASGDKNKPALERQFGIGIARWIENGGAIKFAITPTQPLAVSEFSQPQRLTPERLGLRITNQAPPAR